MRKCSSTILYAACTFRPYKSTPVLKPFRTFTERMTRGLSLRMVFSLLFQDTLFRVDLDKARLRTRSGGKRGGKGGGGFVEACRGRGHACM